MTNPIQVVHDLKDGGFSQQQSESVVAAVLKLQTTNLATKEDIAKLQGELNLVKLMVGGVYALFIPILLKLFLH